MGKLRIIAGLARGRKIDAPEGERVRPTGERVREALFSMLQDRVPGARVLDPFAGSGALGLEAISRGAARATFIESDPGVVRLLRRNIDHLGFGESAELVSGRAERILATPRNDPPFDLVLADPPYSDPVVEPFLAALAETGRMARNGLLVLEREARSEGPQVPAAFEPVRTRTYGRVALDLFRLA